MNTVCAITNSASAPNATKPARGQRARGHVIDRHAGTCAHAKITMPVTSTMFAIVNRLCDAAAMRPRAAADRDRDVEEQCEHRPSASGSGGRGVRRRSRNDWTITTAGAGEQQRGRG